MAAVTLATSKVDDGISHGTSDTHEEWQAPRQSFDVTIRSISDRIDTFDYSGDISLTVSIEFVPEESESAPRWSMRMMEGDEAFELTGDFSYLGGESQTQDNGDSHREIRGIIGRLCHAGETSSNGCIPCIVESGCELTVEVDLCDPSITGFMQARVAVAQDNGEPFEQICVDGDGTKSICHALDEWVEMDRVPGAGSPSLCDP